MTLGQSAFFGIGAYVGAFGFAHGRDHRPDQVIRRPAHYLRMQRPLVREVVVKDGLGYPCSASDVLHACVAMTMAPELAGGSLDDQRAALFGTQSPAALHGA